MLGFTPSGTVALITDFGVTDPFVGIMKAVMLREHPALTLVDVTHGVSPQDVALADLWLSASYGWFAAGAVHLCVVDPGVGSERAAVVTRSNGHLFVAPDNGILSGILRADTAAETRRIDVAELGLSVPSRTFHGRDVFAPIAARLASAKLAFEHVGPPWQPRVEPERGASRSGAALEGEVVAVDHFGNLITNLPERWLEPAFTVVEICGRNLRRVTTYSDAEQGECAALLSSFDTLEIALRNGNAAVELGAGRGTRVRVRTEERG
ncbi:MAG: SAM-dependent chlorinase/fluorinase [Polyangiaceae bacterium]